MHTVDMGYTRRVQEPFAGTLAIPSVQVTQLCWLLSLFTRSSGIMLCITLHTSMIIALGC